MTMKMGTGKRHDTRYRLGGKMSVLNLNSLLITRTEFLFHSNFSENGKGVDRLYIKQLGKGMKGEFEFISLISERMLVDQSKMLAVDKRKKNLG